MVTKKQPHSFGRGAVTFLCDWCMLIKSSQQYLVSLVRGRAFQNHSSVCPPFQDFLHRGFLCNQRVHVYAPASVVAKRVPLALSNPCWRTNLLPLSSSVLIYSIKQAVWWQDVLFKEWWAGGNIARVTCNMVYLLICNWERSLIEINVKLW